MDGKMLLPNYFLYYAITFGIPVMESGIGQSGIRGSHARGRSINALYKLEGYVPIVNMPKKVRISVKLKRSGDKIYLSNT